MIRPSGKMRSHPAVRSSSRRLHRAYQIITGLYGKKAPNRLAFFDHLCALDFI